MKKLLPALLLLLCFGANAQYPIGHRTITYNDPARSNRAISCEVYYPGVSAGNNVTVAVGAFPVIVLGHGFAMGTNVYTNHSSHFVPDGYIMVMPNTEGSLLPAPSHGEFGLDLKFLVDKLESENLAVASPFYGHVTDRAAIMGHSMGGGATILAASGFANVDCIVGMAPAETTPSAVTAAASVMAPALILSGNADGVTPPSNHHIPIYNALGSGCKYLASIAEGSHCYFADYNFNCAFGEMIPGSLSRAEQFAVSWALMDPWFAYFLMDDCDAWDEFETALTTESDLASVTSSCTVTAPVIVDNSGTLEADQQSNYQWYLNGNEISNANLQDYSYTQSGTYQVGSFILGNCPTFSNEISIQITDVDEFDVALRQTDIGAGLSTKTDLNNVTLQWFDLTGKILRSSMIRSIAANQVVSVSKPSAPGVILLRLVSDEAVKTWKLY